jgi:dUTP pyrophosphatase
MPTIKVKLLKDTAILPAHSTPGASGFDLTAAETLELPPHSTGLVSTGLAMEIPQGYEIQVRPRSGLSLKTPLKVLLGTLDSDYRGPIGVIVYNASNEAQTVLQGTRIAQGVVQAVPQANFELVSDLSETKRGKGGFGSTGT